MADSGAVYGLKEWDVICRALEYGHQSILLKAGGIHDSSRWFEDLPRSFYLMPTDFHAQTDLVHWQTPEEYVPASKWSIRSWANVREVFRFEDWDVVKQLSPLHVFKESPVRKRFETQGDQGLWVIVVRVYRLEREWILPDLEEYGGCRSLIPLPDCPVSRTDTPCMDRSQLESILEFCRTLSDG
ncbi:MAG: DUF1802 family protein [Verrucomicrobiota bacterium]